MTEAPVSRSHKLRRRQFIDAQLQGGLLVALVLLEVSMLCLAMLYLYLSFSTLIEANLFTIHSSTQVQLLPEFLKQMGWVVLIMSLVNTLALFIAHAIWGGHIAKVVKAFRSRLQQIGSLDLSPVNQPDTIHHRVLDFMEQWRAQEQRRLQHIKLQVDQISEAHTGLGGQPGDQESLRAELQRLRRLLGPGAVDVERTE